MFKALRILLAALALISPQLSRAASPQDPTQPGETIIVSGGVSLFIWEKYKAQPHDKWWMNFVRAAQIRIAQIQQANPQQPITWLIYRPAYTSRSRQDGQDYTSAINAMGSSMHVRMIWFDRTSQLLNYLNAGQPRDRVKINDLEFFVHSNKACFLFDYSNVIDSASKVWLHENELTKINRGIFTQDALVRSWGCHTGESMSSRFRSATGVTMWGLTGKS
ncbi:MAG: hypothetical protein ABIP20_13900, partial [Chthoniobacteraceae bacterium]